MSTEYSFSEARSHLTNIADNVTFKGERMIITRKGKKPFAIVPIEDLKMIEAMEDMIDIEDAKKALASIKKNGTISLEELKRKLDL